MPKHSLSEAAGRAYMRKVDGVINWYLHLVGDPGVDSPLHFFVAWMAYFTAYALPMVALICAVILVLA